MAVNLSLAEALKATETNLSENVGVNDPTHYEKDLGLLKFLMGSTNKRTISTKMGEAGNAGKYRPVEVRYLPKKGQDDVSEAASGYSCDRGTTRREIIDTYNPTLWASDKFTLDEAIIREGTQMDLNARIQKELQDAMLNVRENIDKQLFAAAITAIGANPSAGVGKDGYKTLQMLNSDGTLDANTFDDIVIDAQDNFMIGNPALVGSNKMRKVVNRLKVGDTQSGGINFKGVETGFGMDFFNDSWTTTNFGTANKDRILAFYPGLVQYFQYNYYKGGIYEDKSGVSIKTTMSDPLFPGITYDVHLKHDDGCSTDNPQGYLVGNVFVYFDLWTAPEGAFGEGYSENLNDFNGIVGYDITQA
jgi:hypothetical protein